MFFIRWMSRLRSGMRLGGDDYAARHPRRWTRLHHCAWNDSGAALMLNLEVVYVDAKDIDGNTPLHLAVAKGHIKIIWLLLLNRANPNVRNRNGWTPLYQACVAGNEVVVASLFLKGGDPGIGNKEGETPVERAIANRFNDIASMLTQDRDSVARSLIADRQEWVKFLLKQ